MEDALFKLEKITDNPEFEGFAFVRDHSLRGTSIGGQSRLVWDFGPDDIKTKGRSWSVPPLAPFWSLQPVVGKVNKLNDYPCVNLTIPAFSQRAVDALSDFLKPNGELLPLISSIGNYYAYNVTTVEDILDHDASEIEWKNESRVTAFDIKRYECIQSKLSDLSVFLIVEQPAHVFVTQRFVNRVAEHLLQGFHFVKVWPLSPGVSWKEMDSLGRKKNRQLKLFDRRS